MAVNKGLGLFKDDAYLIQVAADYLCKHLGGYDD